MADGVASDIRAEEQAGRASVTPAGPQPAVALSLVEKRGKGRECNDSHHNFAFESGLHRRLLVRFVRIASHPRGVFGVSLGQFLRDGRPEARISITVASRAIAEHLGVEAHAISLATAIAAHPFARRVPGSAAAALAEADGAVIFAGRETWPATVALHQLRPHLWVAHAHLYLTGVESLVGKMPFWRGPNRHRPLPTTISLAS